MYNKRFLEWINLKEKLHFKPRKQLCVSEGEIWWASLGENVGSEINGKSQFFSRPVIVIKKLSYGFYFVVPTTSKERNGSWYVHFKQRGKSMNACIHQMRSMDYRRFYSKLGKLDDTDFSRVKQGFLNLCK